MTGNTQEMQVSAAFSSQATVFDALDKANPVIRWMRHRVQQHVLRFAKPGGRVLELNCGTGIDALFFAEKGFTVHATDNAPGMLQELDKKKENSSYASRITAQRLSFNELEKLGREKFDHVFSDFGGLNCANDLSSVLKKIPPLLEPDGRITLVIMPPVCPWEMLQFFKGNFHLARRRFSKSGAGSNVEGTSFKTWYYFPSYVHKALKNDCRLLALEGLASVCPPPYMENFAKRFPRTLRFLQRWDERLCALPPFRSWADHFIITLEKI